MARSDIWGLVHVRRVRDVSVVRGVMDLKLLSHEPSELFTTLNRAFKVANPIWVALPQGGVVLSDKTRVLMNQVVIEPR